MWTKYQLGDYLGLKDKAGRAYTRNVYLKPTPDDAHILIQAIQTPNIPELAGFLPALGIESLQKMGTKFILSANALCAWSLQLPAPAKRNAPNTHKEQRPNSV